MVSATFTAARYPVVVVGTPPASMSTSTTIPEPLHAIPLVTAPFGRVSLPFPITLTLMALGGDMVLGTNVRFASSALRPSHPSLTEAPSKLEQKSALV